MNIWLEKENTSQSTNQSTTKESYQYLLYTIYQMAIINWSINQAIFPQWTNRYINQLKIKLMIKWINKINELRIKNVSK